MPTLNNPAPDQLRELCPDLLVRRRGTGDTHLDHDDLIPGRESSFSPSTVEEANASAMSSSATTKATIRAERRREWMFFFLGFVTSAAASVPIGIGATALAEPPRLVTLVNSAAVVRR
ncbi:hypothetical protein [Planotetraspora phitsanulokensis]|uniref:hypothetical protein n=1 Tax=Planotetraspora phitsanulokensis TaxID=575192 RepID=UPI001EF3BF7D